jgi:exodeoxyribonuclease VII small subunit
MERPDAPSPAGPEAAPRFEDALARLESIVHALEAGNLSLDDSLRAFEEGTGLLRLCTQKLEDVERRIEILVRDEGGLRAQPFLTDEDPS